MAGIVIQQYEQQLTPQGAMLPTDVAKPGAVLGEAVAGLGRAVSGFASDMDQIADRKAKVESARLLADAELSLQEGLQVGADGLGETDPTGFARKYNEGATKVREKLLEKAGDNPHLSGYLKLGFEELQRKSFMSAMKVEREATGKFVGRQVTDLAGANVKLAIIDPSRVGELIGKTTEQIDAAVGVPAEWKAEAKQKAASAIAAGAIESLTNKDPVRAAEILADPKNIITASLSPDRYDDLYDKAQGASIDKQGRDLGGAIAAKAFAGGGLAAMNKEIDKIKDEQVRLAAEKYAKAEYSMLNIQKTEIEQERKRQAYDLATDAVNKGIPFKPPAGLGSYETQQALEYYQRLVEQKEYQAKGGSLTSDQSYVDELQAMLYSDNKAAFIDTIIDQTKLSERDFRTFTTAKAKLKGDRNTAVRDIGPYVDRAMMEAGYKKSPQTQLRSSLWKIALTDAVAQAEDVKKRPLDPPELQKLADDTFKAVSQQPTWFGLTSEAVPAVSKVDSVTASIITKGMVGTSVAITPENIAVIQADIEKHSDQLDKILTDNGIPATPQARADLYMSGYAEQYKRQ